MTNEFTIHPLSFQCRLVGAVQYALPMVESVFEFAYIAVAVGPVHNAPPVRLAFIKPALILGAVKINDPAFSIDTVAGNTTGLYLIACFRGILAAFHRPAVLPLPITLLPVGIGHRAIAMWVAIFPVAFVGVPVGIVANALPVPVAIAKPSRIHSFVAVNVDAPPVFAGTRDAPHGVPVDVVITALGLYVLTRLGMPLKDALLKPAYLPLACAQQAGALAMREVVFPFAFVPATAIWPVTDTDTIVGSIFKLANVLDAVFQNQCAFSILAVTFYTGLGIERTYAPKDC